MNLRIHFVLSCLLGAAAAAFIYWILPNEGFLALTGGILAAAMLFCFMILYEIMQKKRYAWVEEQIQFPVFYKTNGNFDLGAGGIRNGNIYFTEAGILCVCMDKKPGTLDDIPVQNIHRIAYDDIHMHIHTKDGKIFYITLPDVPRIIQLLIDKDWMEFRQSEPLSE